MPSLKEVAELWIVDVLGRIRVPAAKRVGIVDEFAGSGPAGARLRITGPGQVPPAVQRVRRLASGGASRGAWRCSWRWSRAT